jgi:hypothetical protein
VKVTATSVADPSRSGSSTVTISQPPFKPGSGGGGGGGGLDFLVLLIVGASALGRRARLPR